MYPFPTSFAGLRSLLLCLVTPALLGCTATNSQFTNTNVGDQTIVSQSLNGQWSFLPASGAPQAPHEKQTDISAWPTIDVPGNWFTQGWDINGTAWYKRQFDVPTLQDATLTNIHFEGVDYIADIWVNGHYINQHQGFFDQFSFDVSHAINPGASNDITVRVDSPLETKENWSLNKRLIKGVLSHHDTRPGGAWSEQGQDANTGGIWGSVTLSHNAQIAINAISIDAVIDTRQATASTQLTVDLQRHEKATGSFWASVKMYPTGLPEQAVVSRKTFSLADHVAPITLEIPQRDVQLWQPWDHGTSDLYIVEVEVGRGANILDHKQRVFGYRTTTRDADTGSWNVNGKRLFLRGTNYIPGQWFADLNREKLRFDLELIKRANINAIRVHAIVLPNYFYELCDEMGLLVWQDFPLQWGYSDSPVFEKDALRQLERMITQLDHHPSIFAWSMHNEPPWDASWMQYKYPAYNKDQNKTLDESLYQRALQLDSDRYVHMASKTSEHPWFGWYSGSWKDYAKNTQQSLITEYGAQALPDVDSLKRIFGSEHLWPEDETTWSMWQYHNFQYRETFELAKVKQGSNLNEFIHNSQSYQARLIKLAAESYRRQRYTPVSGIFQFMFVEGWPSVNWGVVDYYRQPKAGYKSLQIAYQPTLPAISQLEEQYPQHSTIKLTPWIVNDTLAEYKDATLSIVYSHASSVIDHYQEKIDLDADQLKESADWTTTLSAKGVHSLDLTVTDANGVILGINHYTFDVVNNNTTADSNIEP